jgi:hypothetical protein
LVSFLVPISMTLPTSSRHRERSAANQNDRVQLPLIRFGHGKQRLQTMSDSESEDSGRQFVWYFVRLCGFAVIVWAGFTLLFFYVFAQGDEARAAAIGDSFGAVNALFAALAFGGVIVAILMQRQELQLQRRELHATLEEIKKSREAQEQSQLAHNQQANWLFNAAYLNALSSLHNFYTADTNAPEQFSVTPQAKIQSLIETLVTRMESKGGVGIYARERAAAISLITHLRNHREAFRLMPNSQRIAVEGAEVVRKLDEFMRNISSKYPFSDCLSKLSGQHADIVRHSATVFLSYYRGQEQSRFGGEMHQAFNEIISTLDRWLFDLGQTLELFGPKPGGG